jgi:hypothetical protein
VGRTDHVAARGEPGGKRVRHAAAGVLTPRYDAPATAHGTVQRLNGS